MLKGYLDDPTVPPGSLCPTFAAIAFHIDNARWDGVPFLMKAGKALDKRYAEIRVQFRHVPGNLYKRGGQLNNDLTNELVIRIQPDEAVYLKINNKVPGLGMVLDRSTLDLKYKARYQKELPDAYERLILDVVMGDKRLFIRNDELEAAWKLFTPLLQTIERNKMAPELYPYGSRGPVGAHYLGASPRAAAPRRARTRGRKLSCCVRRRVCRATDVGALFALFALYEQVPSTTSGGGTRCKGR